MQNRPDYGNRRGQPDRGPAEQFVPDTARLDKILSGDVAVLNEYAKELGELFKQPLYVSVHGKKKEEKELATSQVRGVLDAVHRIKADETSQMLQELQLLRPKLAYAAGRHRGRVRQFQEVVEAAILKVSNEEQFKFFKAFIEAIVAYHRCAGGKE